jgi:virulence-associated protein VagC
MGHSSDRRAVKRAGPIPPGTRLTARVFRTGNSQAVRLPKEMRFSTSEVTVHREGRRLVLEPLEIERDAKGWPKAFWTLGGSAPDFEVGDRGAPHERRDALAPRR